MENINVLSDAVIGKISAGEVVERPASVVKELVENSIDAGASSIYIEIKQAGNTLIRVSDNGMGMSESDLLKAPLRHATSKLTGIDDLEKLTTMGFRGEALSSIGSVSRMEITTAPEGASEAKRVTIEDGKIIGHKPAARSHGTTVEVHNLFYNVPARKKFLKRDATELAVITDIVGRMILASSQTEFKLVHGERVLLHATANMGLLDRIRLVLGSTMSEGMIEISLSDGKYTVSGYTSKPSVTRRDRNAQVFFINNRFVKSRLMQNAVYVAYRTLLERGRYPACVLFVDVDPKDVDVNVHPTKMQVKFDDENSLKNVIIKSIRKSFEEIKTDISRPDLEVVRKDFSGILDRREFETGSGELNIFKTESQPEFGYEGGSVETGAGQQNLTEIPVSASGGENFFEKRGTIFQVAGCYIVQVQDTAVKITDQHAAHERILYEYFSKRSKSSSGDVQNLLFPVQLDLSPADAILINKLLPDFAKLGFIVEGFGGNSFIVQAAPAVLNDRDIKKVVLDILTDLNEDNAPEIDALERLIKYASCRGAIMAGDRLSADEMLVLLSKLDKCELPFTCPHGRPVSFEVTPEEMEKRFRRK